ncbi:hypothetical protein ACFLQS_03750 [Actinomycetota bacterium]
MKGGFEYMVEIRSFGSLLSFCLDLEEKLENFYLELSTNKENKTYTTLFSKLAKKNKRRGSLLERIRRENINEMILQSINGLIPGNNLTNIDSTIDLEFMDLLKKAIDFERSSSVFYLDASNKASLILAESSRYFKKLSKENEDRSLELEMIYSELNN